MCGRYTETHKGKDVLERFDCRVEPIRIEPRYNIAPGQMAPVVLQSRERMLRMMSWGLLPHWARDESAGLHLINARADTLIDKPSFRDSFKHKRCLVPADSFYEWHPVERGRRKTPFRFMLKTSALFAFAGLWDVWHGPAGQEIYSFSIITTEGNALVKPYHERMPVILLPEHEDVWLDAQCSTKSLQQLLRAYPADRMTCYPVSTYVNSPNHEGPDCVVELESGSGLLEGLPLWDPP